LKLKESGSLSGYLFVLAAIAIWSGNFIIARGLSNSIPPVTLAFLRGLVAVVVLIPFGIRPLYRNIRTVRKHLGYLCLTGFLGLTVCNTLVYIAAHSSQALNMSLIAMCSPIFLALFARLFLHDTFTLRRIVGLIAGTLGAVLLVTDGQLGRLMSLTLSEGDAWMLIQAATFALYSILVQVKPAELSDRVFLSSMFVLGWLFLVPWFIWELITDVRSINFSPAALGAIIYLGIGPFLLAFLCWNRAIAIIGPVKVGLVYYCFPLLIGIEAFVLLDEPVYWVHAVSGVLILSGVLIATRE
jgi:drug/metabolite transporter (DMT)-like permease